MRSFRSSFLVLPSLLVMFSSVTSAPFASGQRSNSSSQIKPQPATAPQQSPSAETTTTRSRRAVPASPEQKSVENQPPSKPDEATLISEDSVPPNSEITLREEIRAATNDQARARLQLKLVDELVSAGLKQDAIAELKTMSGEERFDPQGFYNLANAQARLGDSEGAVKSYRKAIQQRKGRYSRASNNLGVVLLRTGHWDEAYEAFISALTQESLRNAEASFNLGRLYAARGENDLAVREWRRAVAVNPKHEAAARAISNTVRDGKIAATSPAPRPISSSPSSGEPGKAAVTGASQPHRVASRPAPAYTIDPETYALLKRGRTARERGRNEEAVENYRQVLARMGGYFPPANLELSYALMALKRNDEAIEALLPVSLKDGGQIPISYFHLGRLYELRGDLKQAEGYYTRAAEAYGDSNNQFILDVGRVREKQGNVLGALMSLEQYVNAMERQGQKPEWSDERLTALRQKLAASQPKP